MYLQKQAVEKPMNLPIYKPTLFSYDTKIVLSKKNPLFEISI